KLPDHNYLVHELDEVQYKEASKTTVSKNNDDFESVMNTLQTPDSKNTNFPCTCLAIAIVPVD
ncbi:hypothetical protein ACJMK2_036195, partial [Sinanodonta woodiana]